ncbi:MAG: outer membrane beta-barrel domain-containing protein [Acidobacteria bacterium]|nr:outer membrane beta-barrel domain-containing protein [Acidobacteriota bacterium]
MLRRSLIILSILLVCGFFAAAEENDGRIEASAYVGFIRFQDSTNLESTYISGGRFSYAFTDHVAVEGQFGYLNADVRNPLQVPLEDNQFGWPDQTTKGVTFGGGVLYHFLPKEKVNPFVYAGMGIAHFIPNVTDSVNKFMAEFGGGVKIWLNKNIAFRADIRDAIIFSSTRHNLVLTAGLVFGFGDL